jgi:hypothetical protein
MKAAISRQSKRDWLRFPSHTFGKFLIILVVLAAPAFTLDKDQSFVTPEAKLPGNNENAGASSIEDKVARGTATDDEGCETVIFFDHDENGILWEEIVVGDCRVSQSLPSAHALISLSSSSKLLP